MEILSVPPRPERSALVRISFASSPALDDALHRFLLPSRDQRPVSLYSEQYTRLPYDWSDASGPRYARADARRLANQEAQLRDMGQQPIKIHSMQALASSRGDWRLRFELDPTIHQRRQLGGVVLGSLMEERDVKVWAYTYLWHGVAMSAGEVMKEAARLNQLITPLDRQRLDPDVEPQRKGRRTRAFDDIASRFFVLRPHVIERTGDLRGLK